jgi:hypothetical protein
LPLRQLRVYNPAVDTASSTSEFPVTRCAVCEKDVLCYLDLDDEGREVARCLDCSAAADRETLRWLDLHALEELGYGFVLPEAGCGRPDCGKGRCGRASPNDPQDG